jgi:predicted Zn-dependent peptidase
MSDLQNLSRTDAQQFFEKYYHASNLTVGVAGDVDPARMRDLAEQYFGRLPEGEEPMPVTTREPEHRGERRVVIREDTKPLFMIGYLRPSMHSPDAPAYDVLSYVLTRGRTSRLHERLVETEQALVVRAFPTYPFGAGKYQNQFVLFGAPSRGVSPDTVEQIIYDELEAIQSEGITQAELERAKTRARADLIGGLDSNSGLARRFAQKQALTGDWRDIFRRLAEIEALTVEDVRRVAEETFRRSNRTVALIKSTDDEDGQRTADAN